jgi:uncharacterized protein (TIGR03083 family)
MTTQTATPSAAAAVPLPGVVGSALIPIFCACAAEPSGTRAGIPGGGGRATVDRHLDRRSQPRPIGHGSLCAGWDVKTVAAHLVSDFADGFWGFMASGTRHSSIDRGIDALARHRARASAAEIAETLRRRADHRLSPPVTGPLSGLTDVLVHGADMRIPLGLPHRPVPQHVARVLDFLTSPTQLGFFPRRSLRGIAFHDEDTGRTWGDGESIRGSDVAVMLAGCGRTVALDRLAGPGLPVLQSRLT